MGRSVVVDLVVITRSRSSERSEEGGDVIASPLQKGEAISWLIIMSFKITSSLTKTEQYWVGVVSNKLLLRGERRFYKRQQPAFLFRNIFTQACHSYWQSPAGDLLM
jgi:hypothetical protein